MERARDILIFWFGEVPGPELERPLALVRRLPYWAGNWGKWLFDVDGRIRERFGADLERAAAGAYDHWRAAPSGRLALLILLDQMSRNVHRGTDQAFAYDAKGLQVALAALDAGDDRRVHPVARSFHYLPLMHQEGLDFQERSVALYAAAWRDARGLARLVVGAEYASALRHRQIIRAFGRFPHRNVALGRVSTPAELRFLRQPMSSF